MTLPVRQISTVPWMPCTVCVAPGGKTISSVKLDVLVPEALLLVMMAFLRKMAVSPLTARQGAVFALGRPGRKNPEPSSQITRLAFIATDTQAGFLCRNRQRFGDLLWSSFPQTVYYGLARSGS
ncbi:hypothetical protein CAL20_09430 [Bordetella genomosp. 4]|uniref:Uncharacterized protein n=1 Tax=Bordetella genomosp. 4 TaxID=463044 RepID=A0A261U7J0_9BORD|nr:hypothetical protein CAL20_09430 [Bordetella genomosp. 4]